MNEIQEIAKVFLKSGTISFGSPAAHIASMEKEIVQKRSRVSEQHLLDLNGRIIKAE